MRIAATLAASFLCLCGLAQELEWTFPLDAPGSAPTLYPNEAGPTGIAVVAGRLVALLDGRGAPKWTADLADDLAGPATVADIDRDGESELLVMSVNGKLICLTATGQPLWERDFNTPTGGFKNVVAADLVAAPGMELVIGFDDGWLNCVGAKGDVLWRFFGDRGRVGGIAAADVDADGAPEIVYGTDNGHVYCLTGDGRVEWRYDELAPYGRSGPNIADANADGKPEVYITRSNVGNATCIMALDAATGAFLWRSKDIQQGYVSNAIVDLDGDGKSEILHGDKGNFLYCENADGSRRWQVELGGRGLFWAPAVGDVDGDGSPEIVAGMRGTDAKTGATVFVIGADGAIESTIKAGSSTNASPALADIDSDGAIELIVVAEGPKNEVQCYSWGKSGAIGWPSIRGKSAMTANSSVPLGAPSDVPLRTPQDRRAREERSVVWGDNTWHVDLPFPASSSTFIEIAVQAEGQPHTTRVYDIKPGQTAVDLRWSYAHGERALVDVRHFDRDQSRFIITANVIPGPVDACGLQELAKEADRVSQARIGARLDALLVSAKLASLRTEADAVRQRAGARAPYDELADAATALRRSAEALRSTIAAFDALGPDNPATFTCSIDENPWDTFDHTTPTPPHAESEVLRITAYQDEFEDAALSLFNLTSESLDVRCQFFEPATSQGRPPGDPKETRAVTLRRALPIRTASGDRVWDALPELDHSRSLTIPGGEGRQLWLTLNTHGMQPGTQTFTLYLSTLGTEPFTRQVPIEFTVWPVALPGTVYRKMNWSNFNFSDASDQAIRDMIDHGINTIYGPGLPTIPVNAAGELAGEIDWSAFDAVMSRIPKHFFLMWGSPAPLKWPGDVPAVDSETHIAGIRTAIHEMNRHLDPLGFGYDQWAFYPMDEPWNTGFTGIPELKAFCSRVKKAEPSAQIYADPAGSTRIEYVSEFKGLIDVWQPEMNILKRDPALVKWFQENSKHFWAYEATGPGKEMLPLGYYRAYAWLAWSLGTEGAGYWVYRGEDTWWPVGGGDWSAVYQSNEFVVPSRRFQADRDGVEDYRALYLLREEAKKARAAGRNAEAIKAETLIDEAVSKVVGWQIGAIDEITRFTRDYELDYGLLLDYRERIAELIVQMRSASSG
ncbi:MAG: PQQ-like beta-propeller repeat protein [Candidatus Hydrogenedentes bacterium]|nr:PQQ-like beta-propeller repeat protein [Candidatus Hydrogenedentota bacterium]